MHTIYLSSTLVCAHYRLQLTIKRFSSRCSPLKQSCAHQTLHYLSLPNDMPLEVVIHVPKKYNHHLCICGSIFTQLSHRQLACSLCISALSQSSQWQVLRLSCFLIVTHERQVHTHCLSCSNDTRQLWQDLVCSHLP